MKINYKKVIAVIVLIIMGIILYSWFNVSGKEIKGVYEISEDCTVQIEVMEAGIKGTEVKYNLNSIQIEMLKTLILNSSFTQRLSPSITVPNNTQRYWITIDWHNVSNENDETDFLHIESMGNKYIRIMGKINGKFFEINNGKFLKMNNPDWEKELKEIIWISK